LREFQGAWGRARRKARTPTDPEIVRPSSLPFLWARWKAFKPPKMSSAHEAISTGGCINSQGLDREAFSLSLSLSLS
jgi:hypothetical protein